MEGSRLRVTLVILILVLVVLGLLSIAFLWQNRERAASTAKPTPTFQNPFAQESQNPFATDSGYQNPFETTKSGSKAYKNPFENLR